MSFDFFYIFSQPWPSLVVQKSKISKNENARVSNLPRVDGGRKFPKRLWPWPFDLDLQHLTLTFVTLTLTYDLWPTTLTSWPWPLWPWPLTLTSFSGRRLKNMIFMFDLDLWPTTLTFNPIQARVKVNLHAKNQGRSSNGLAMRAQTDGQTHRQTHTHTMPKRLHLTRLRDVGCKKLNHREIVRVPISQPVGWNQPLRDQIWSFLRSV